MFACVRACVCVCVCVRVRACVRACVRARVRACVAPHAATLIGQRFTRKRLRVRIPRIQHERQRSPIVLSSGLQMKHGIIRLVSSSRLRMRVCILVRCSDVQSGDCRSLRDALRDIPGSLFALPAGARQRNRLQINRHSGRL